MNRDLITRTPLPLYDLPGPKSAEFRREAHAAIPGGAHTYSKGDDQFPQCSPAAIERGLGGRVWDLDGNEFVDCSMGLGSVSLGHAYEPVLEAVRSQLGRGSNFQRPADIELDFAKKFIAAVPGAERVKFAKNGSTVTSAAVKLARAFTGRDLVAFPANHPFFSYDDWFIAGTPCRAGIPEAVRALSVTYHSERPDTLEQLYRGYPNQIACVVTEPEDPFGCRPEILQETAHIARRNGSVFVLDEMVTGYRSGWPGSFVNLGVRPDLIAWGKAIGNGFSFCALTGRADIMDLGGIRQSSRPRVFLISTTHGAEAHAVAAARAVLREYQTRSVLEKLRTAVRTVAEGMRSAARASRIQGILEIHATPWRVITVCRDPAGSVSAPFRSLLLQEMIRRGTLFQGAFLPCFSHTDDDLAHIIRAFEESCEIYRSAIEGGIEKFLIGPPVQPVFRKYNACETSCPADPCPFEARCQTVKII